MATESPSPIEGLKKAVSNFEIGDVKDKAMVVGGAIKDNLTQGQVGERGEAWAATQLVFLLCILLGGIPVVGDVIFTLSGPGLLLGGVALISSGILELGASTTPFVAPTEGNKLKTTGPYAYIRHPMYTGAIAAAFGFGVVTGSVDRMLLAGLLAIFLDQKASREEEALAEKHVAYDTYKEEVSKFFPALY
mmetsp:Transcript_1007/g.2764  ORF Transcript_1007/g.2764 Transcript_1007/m.2764 type:complete len:191 (-) Transcript_1007:231-803(-)